MLLLVATAGAHLPHDEVIAMAAREDETLHAVGVYTASGVPHRGPWVLVAWEDGHWEPFSHPPTLEQVVDLAWAGTTLVLLDASGMVWTGPDPWVAEDGPPATGWTALAATSDTLWVGTDAGLWSRPAAGGAWSMEVEGTIAGVWADTDDVAAATTDGTVWHDGATRPALASVVAVSPDATFAATPSRVYRWEDDWMACGVLPVSDLHPAEKGEIVALAAEAGHLLVGTGQWAYSSTDGGQSFVEETPFPDPVRYGSGPGDIETAERVYTEIRITAHHRVVAGHHGVSVDDGSGWVPGRIVDGGYTRDLTRDGSDWLSASYGAGLLRTADGGETFSLLGSDLPPAERFGSAVAPLAAPALLYCGDLTCFRYEEGVGFADLEAPFTASAFDTAGGFAWALPRPGHGGAVARTHDGLSWTNLAVGVGAGRRIDEVRLFGRDALLLRTKEPDAAFVSLDAGTSWGPLVDDGALLTALVTWPPQAGSRLIRAGEVIRLSDDGGATWRDVPAGPVLPQHLIVDGTAVYAVDAADGGWVSDDGGETWEAAGSPGAYVVRLVAGAGVIVAATKEGVAWSDDHGATWTLAPGMDGATAASADLRCAAAAAGGCGRGDTLELSSGDVVTLDTRASTFWFLGSGALRLRSGDVDLGSVGPDTPVVLPGSGWRTVTGEAEGEASVLQVYGDLDGVPIPELGGDTGEEPTGAPEAGPGDVGCAGGSGEAGCVHGGGSPTHVWVLGLLAWRRRR